MIRDVFISGRTSERHEYSAAVVGPNLNIRLIYDGRGELGKAYDRFFSGGSEIRITERGVGHTGTGGTFCSYMFGVDIPETDLLRSDVRNRLVMHGARYDDVNDRLVFSNDTAGFETFARLFRDGHAFTNYYFFVAGDLQANMRTAQEAILRVAGKFLKRHDLHATARDLRALAAALHESFGAPSWTLFLVKIVDAYAESYFNQYRAAYQPTRELGDDERHSFDLLARHYALDPFQQERIHLDVIYEQEDNKRVIDAYKEALTAHLEQALPEYTLLPKLNLLRAFSARNHIPVAIFDRLDSLLLDLGQHRSQIDPPFVADARQILEDLFVRRIGNDLDVASLVRLLHAKRQAIEQRYVGFEAVLLDAAHASDEWARRGQAGKLRSQFEQLTNYLDLFDRASALVNSIAFIDDFDLTTDRLEELLESQKAFDELKPQLFEELFVAPLEENQYLSLYGRRRLEALRKGLRAADKDPASAPMIGESVRRTNEAARLHRLIESMVRGLVGNLHDEPLDDAQKGVLRRDVVARLRAEHGITTAVDDNLFDAVLLGIEEEYFYSTKLLPTIVATRDLKLRDNFLKSSGLDLFRVEELEAAFVHDLKPNALTSAGN
jgi:uncharacterized protein (TIGR04442 family)